jgi:PAS domain S-box-containing protein
VTLTDGDGRHLVGSAGLPPDGDAHLDVSSRFAELGAVAYAAAPVQRSPGTVLGSFSVLDTQPRSWTPDELATLEDLAATAVCELDARENRRDLARGEQQYRALVEQAPVCTYRQIASGNELAYLGPQVEALTGYRPEEWSDALFGERLHPEDRDFVLGEVSRCRSEGREFSMEYRFITRDGRTVWLFDKTVPIRDHEGRIVFRQGFLLDVTPEKEAEAALQVREAQLLQSQRLDAIGNLAGGVAHDFNNILLVIRGYCGLLLDEVGGATDAEHVRQIDAAAERGADLVRQLLAYGRRQRLEPVRANLNDLVAGIQTFLERLIGEDVELRTSLDADLPPVYVDTARVEEAIVNLAANARDAMPAGGTVLIATLTVDLPRAAVDGLPAGRYVALSVSDTGMGMDEAVARQVFDPFFTTKPEGQGTGLGLARVHGLVAQSGGAVNVQSAPGTGARFTLYFPVVAGVPDRRDSAPVIEHAAAGGERILLVEDRADVRAVIGEMLRRTGYDVVAASHPAEALELLAQESFAVDLVLTDVVMPAMSGVELARLARDLRREVPVLLMSGYLAPAVLETHPISRNHLLHKPFGPAELAAAVREALEPAA